MHHIRVKKLFFKCKQLRILLQECWKKQLLVSYVFVRQCWFQNLTELAINTSDRRRYGRLGTYPVIVSLLLMRGYLSLVRLLGLLQLLLHVLSLLPGSQTVLDVQLRPKHLPSSLCGMCGSVYLPQKVKCQEVFTLWHRRANTDEYFWGLNPQGFGMFYLINYIIW